MWKFSSRKARTAAAKKPRPLGMERLEDRLTPAYYSVPSAVQTLSAIGIPSNSPAASSGPTYYVSPTGSGALSTNPSAPGNARATLTSSSLPNNATIIFQDGTYRDLPSSQTGGIVLNKSGLTLQAAAGAKPWILGSKVATGWSAATNVTINNVSTPLSFATEASNTWLRTFTGTTDYNAHYNDGVEVNSAIPTARNLDMVFVDGVSYKQVLDNPTTAGTREGPEWFGPGKFWIGDVGGQTRVYLGANPAGKQVEVTAYGRALLNWGNLPDTTIRGLGFAHFAFTPVDIRSARTTIESSTFAWNGYNGLTLFGNNGGAADSTTDDSVIRGNRFVANGSAGMLARAVNDSVVENNYVAYNNVEAFRTSWTAAGFKVFRTSDVAIRGNTVEGNFATGIWLDIDVFRADVVKNVVRSNTSGVFVELSHDNVVAFNVIRDNTSEGIRVYESSKTRVYNNTIVNNKTGIRVLDSSRGQVQPDSYQDPNSAEFLAGSTHDTYDNEIVNNIIASTTGATDNVLLDAAPTNSLAPRVRRNGVTSTDTRTSATMVSRLDGNVYYDTSSPVFVKWDNTNDGVAGTLSYSTLTAFRSAFPAYEASGLSANPLFVGTGSTDWERYALQSTSTLKGKGLAIPADILAAVGRSSSAPRLVGAIDVVAAPNSAPTDISLSSTSVTAGVAGAVVGTLTATDPNAGDTFTFSLVSGASNNWRFEVVGNQLRVVTPPPAGTTTQWVTVRVTDAGGLTFDKAFQITFVAAAPNAAPTDISLSGTSVQRVAGAVVGTLTATDPNPGDTLTFSLVDGASNNWRFVIEGNQLKLASPPPAGTTTQWVTVRVTDAGGLWYDEAFLITIV